MRSKFVILKKIIEKSQPLVLYSLRTYIYIYTLLYKYVNSLHNHSWSADRHANQSQATKTHTQCSVLLIGYIKLKVKMKVDYCYHRAMVAPSIIGRRLPCLETNLSLAIPTANPDTKVNTETESRHKIGWFGMGAYLSITLLNSTAINLLYFVFKYSMWRL